MVLTPFYFQGLNFLYNIEEQKKTEELKNKDYVFYCHKQLVNSSTCSLVHSFLCYYVFLTSNLLTRLLINSFTRPLNFILFENNCRIICLNSFISYLCTRNKQL